MFSLVLFQGVQRPLQKEAQRVRACAFTSANPLLTLFPLDLLHHTLLGGAVVGSWLWYVRASGRATSPRGW